MTAYDPRTATGIPTEPVGSPPRPSRLQDAHAKYDAGEITRDQLEAEQDQAVRDSITRAEATGEPIISGGDSAGPASPRMPPPTPWPAPGWPTIWPARAASTLPSSPTGTAASFPA
jgi:hypothetical protein